MAYNYFPAGYQPAMYYPTQSNAFPTQMSVAPTQMSVGSAQNPALIWVQGEAGAKSYLVAPNQTVTLWDSESQVIYLKSADASGMPSIKVLDYTIRDTAPHKPENATQNDFATKDDVNTLKGEIEALKRKFSNSASAEVTEGSER